MTHATERTACKDKTYWTERRVENQRIWMEKLIDPNWEICHNDHSYGLNSLIKWLKEKKTIRKKLENSIKVVSKKIICLKNNWVSFLLNYYHFYKIIF